MKNLFCAVIVWVGLASTPSFAQSAIDGTWKVDLDSYSQARKPASYFVRDGMFECASCPGKYRIQADGRDYPVEDGVSYDTLAVRFPDSRTVETIGKKAGKVVSRSTMKVAPDDRSMRLHSTTIRNGHRSTQSATLARTAGGPQGSHWLSGSWRRNKVESMSDALVTFRTEADMLSMSSPHGGSYKARLDGTQSPSTGDPSTTTVAVRMNGNDTLEEQSFRNGKLYITTTMQVDAAGNTARVTWTHPPSQEWAAKYLFAPDADSATGSYTMTRQ